MIGYIYKITNTTDGRFYIGKRQKEKFDSKYWGSSRELLIDICRKGEEFFKREVIDTAETIDELVKKEIFHIMNSNAIELGYNKSRGGEGLVKEIKEENTYSLVGQVFQTKDYDSFGSIKGNRKVDKAHVSRIASEFKKIGQLSPIIVNKNLEVVDGQHRLEASRLIEYPIQYIIVDTSSMDAIKSINNINKKWTVNDYVNNHADLGNEHYLFLEKHIEQYENTSYRIPTNALIKIMSGNINTLSVAYSMEKIKDGSFKVHSYSGFEELFAKYQAVIDTINLSKALPRELSIPLITLIGHSNFDLLRLLQKLKNESNLSVIQSNWLNTDTGQVFTLLANMYNKGLSDNSPNAIHWVTDTKFGRGQMLTFFQPVAQNLSSKYSNRPQTT